jgi:hypothetical protein
MILRAVLSTVAFSLFSGLAHAAPGVLPKTVVQMPEGSSFGIFAMDLALTLVAILLIQRRASQSQR